MISTEEYSRRKNNLMALEKFVRPQDALELDWATAISTTKNPIISEGFVDCNLFIIKNVDSGESILFHAYYGISKPSDAFAGLSTDIKIKLEQFCSKHGKKKAIRLYNNSGSLDFPGGKNDGNLSNYLKGRGIHTQDIDLHEFLNIELFDIAYDPLSDRLDIIAAARPEEDLPREIGGPECQYISYTLHPFSRVPFFRGSL